MMHKEISLELANFIKNSPTAYHAVENIASMLDGVGYTPINEEKKLVPGAKHYITKNLSSIVAFTVPSDEILGFNIIAAHSDSPCFRLTDNFEIERNNAQTLATERYGGPTLSTWFDRPLCIAGKIIYEDEGNLNSILVDLKRTALIIPNTSPHLNREINNGYKYNPSVDTNPLFSMSESKGHLMNELCDIAKIQQCSVRGFDLMVYSKSEPSIWGPCEEFISAPRLDDLQCVFCATKAFIDAKPSQNRSSVLAVFDNEEIGSRTIQGAAGTFLLDTLKKISGGGDRIADIIASSVVVSADNAHACHPNHPELSNSQSRVFLNGGVVLKFSASRSYTTDALSGAIFTTIVKRANIPSQVYYNRADLPGGGTLGAVSLSQVCAISFDIGAAQHAMHSAYETAGTADNTALYDFSKAFYNTDFKMLRDGQIQIV